jgi:signal transduction histidine kinase
METFLTTALCGFARFNGEGAINYANGSLARWLDSDPAELGGQPLDSVLDPDSARRLWEDVIPRVRTHGEPIVENLNLRGRANHTPIPVLASLSVVEAPESATPVYQAVFLRAPAPDEPTFPSPAADRKTHALDEAEVKRLSELSHELRTPLQAISLTTYVLLEGESGPINDDQKEDLLRIQRAAHEVGRLVDEILRQVRIVK